MCGMEEEHPEKNNNKHKRIRFLSFVICNMYPFKPWMSCLFLSDLIEFGSDQFSSCCVHPLHHYHL